MKMKMKMKKVYAVDLVLIIGSVLILMMAVNYSRPLVIAPLDELETTERSILFSLEKADEILIDDNIEFSSPERYTARDGLEISLGPGKYYWKATGVIDSAVRTLIINSKVDLRLLEGDRGYGVINAGNVRLHVEIYNESSFVESVKVGVGEEIYGENKFIGESDE
jgi:hypothetical protein